MGQKLTLDQVAEEWQCSKRTVRRLITSGELRAVRMGRDRLIRVDRDDLDAAARPVQPGEVLA